VNRFESLGAKFSAAGACAAPGFPGLHRSGSHSPRRRPPLTRKELSATAGPLKNLRLALTHSILDGMKHIALLVGCLVFIPRLAGADDFKLDDGYISLFNGHDLTGWGYTASDRFDGKTEASDGRYSAKDGILTVHPHDAKKGPRLRQMWTTQEFPKDFHLKLEFRAAVNADSGVFLRKPQLQCRDYLVAGPYKTLRKYKPQDWNELEVVVKDNLAHCTCNGELLEDALKLPETGPIGLEADRGQMEYRHIQIKE
jgi:hypothetical protein